MNPEILQRLESLEQEGERLKYHLAQSTGQATARKDLGNAATELLGSMFLPHGMKGTGKNLAKKSLSLQKQRVDNESASIADRWLDSIIKYLKQVSKVTPTITARGNSSVLVKKFNAAKSAAKADTKFSRGISALQQLQTYDLVYTTELKALLQERKLNQATVSKYKHLSTEAKKILKNNPSELEALLGAIESLEKGGLDKNRQCLSSCRNCLENFVKRTSGENDWKRGLSLIVPSTTKQKTIKNAYQFLSAYGVHGTENPTDDDTLSGIEQTISTIRLIVKNS